VNTFWNSQAQTLAVVMSKDDALRYASMLECWDYGSDTDEAARCTTDAKQIRLVIPTPEPKPESSAG